MATKKIDVKQSSLLVDTFMDEAQVNGLLIENGFEPEFCTWVYSWTPPAWASDQRKAEIVSRLEESDYESYLINVRQEKESSRV